MAYFCQYVSRWGLCCQTVSIRVTHLCSLLCSRGKYVFNNMIFCISVTTRSTWMSASDYSIYGACVYIFSQSTQGKWVHWKHTDPHIHIFHGSACIIGWKTGLLDILISTYIAQFMGCVISRIHYGLKVVSCFRYFTASHYHHDTRLLTGVEHMQMPVKFILWRCV